jgi:hypothetical protein
VWPVIEIRLGMADRLIRATCSSKMPWFVGVRNGGDSRSGTSPDLP